MDKRIVITAAMIAVTVSGLPNGAWAGSKVFAYLDTTTRINGTVEANADGNLDPFVAQVFVGANECLRVEVVAQGADLKATLVATNGRVWQDDDSAGQLRPLIKAIAPTRGWYPLVISQFVGTPVNADFVVDISRASTNSLCTPPTASATASAAQTKAPAASFTKAPGGTRR